MQAEKDTFINKLLPYFYFKVLMQDADVSISTNIVHAGSQLYFSGHGPRGGFKRNEKNGRVFY